LVPSPLPGTSAPSSGIDKAWPSNENQESEVSATAAGQPKPPSVALDKSNTHVNPNVVVSAHAGQRAKTAQERSILFWSNSAERDPSASKDFQSQEDVTIKNVNWYRDPKPAMPKFESCDDCQRIFLSSQVRYFLSWIYYHD
jgi:hypothetical protein